MCLILGCTRLVLFGNPWAWRYYHSNLTPDDIDYRPHDVLALKRNEFSLGLYHTPKTVLAVGSSQVQALFDSESAKQLDIDTLSIAGMGPLDLVLYQNEIKNRKPKIVILYLSEFDLARLPDLNVALIAPAQGTHWLTVFKLLKPHQNLWPDLNLQVIRAIGGELVPEFKYSYIFRGLWDKFSKRDVAFRIKLNSAVSDADALRLQANNLQRNLDADAIEPSISLLKHFVRFCSKNSTSVVILEGQVNPLIETNASKRLHHRVSGLLEELAKTESNVKYVSLPGLRLQAKDFRDGTHCKKESSKEWLLKLNEAILR